MIELINLYHELEIHRGKITQMQKGFNKYFSELKKNKNYNEIINEDNTVHVDYASKTKEYADYLEKEKELIAKTILYPQDVFGTWDMRLNKKQRDAISYYSIGKPSTLNRRNKWRNKWKILKKFASMFGNS